MKIKLHIIFFTIAILAINLVSGYQLLSCHRRAFLSRSLSGVVGGLTFVAGVHEASSAVTGDVDDAVKQQPLRQKQQDDKSAAAREAERERRRKEDEERRIAEETKMRLAAGRIGRI
jgi:hypothetical protein